MKRRITWFEFGLAMFAAALPVGVVLILVAPFDFFHFVGAMVVGTALVGLWVSALGLRLEHPQRWHELTAALARLATASSPPRRTVQR
jgi:hypothetical protein